MWQLEYKGEVKSFEEWGIKNVLRRLVSLDVDTVSFEAVADFDAEDLFAANAVITIWRDGSPWFTGQVDQTPRTATGRYEGQSYVIAGPWWDLKDLTYQARWKQLTNPLDPSQGYSLELRSHVILNMDLVGRSIYSTKVQILSVLNYVLLSADDQGRPRPFQIGTINIPDAYPWLDEVVDLKCEEIIHRQLRWTPDVVSWFDYTTTPPTLHLKQRSALTVAAAQFGGDDLIECAVKPRYDLQVSEVVLKYESVNVINGLAYPNLTVDTAPPSATGQSRRAILQTINLEGAQISYSLAQIVCEPIRAAEKEWWKEQYRPLGEEGVEDIVIDPESIARATELPRYLVAGNITGWMLARTNATAVREAIDARASWSFKEESQVLEKKVDKALHTELVATDLTTGIYYSSMSVQLAEPVPVGLANYIYQATKFLHYDGTITLSEQECSSRIGVGNVVNILGAKPEYETMRAIVQSVTEDVESGRTTVVVGPPKHLGLDDVIEYLRNSRTRRRTTPMSTVLDGQSFTASPIDIGQETARKNSNSDNGKLDKFTVAQNVIIDRDNLPARFQVKGGPDVRLRELSYCDNGVEKKILVLASAPY